MADMTKSQYKSVATVLLREGQRIQTLTNRWAEERHGEHEMTDLQRNALFYSKIVLNNILEDLIEAYNNQYSNFNEDIFRKAVAPNMYHYCHICDTSEASVALCYVCDGCGVSAKDAIGEYDGMEAFYCVECQWDDEECWRITEQWDSVSF